MEELKEFGLSDNEITIYLTLLKTGTSTANRISQITGLKRSTTYDNLSLLITKGIVSGVTKEKVHYFESANPKKIVHLLEEKKEKIQKIIPELLKLKECIGKKTGVTYFEGKKGVLTVLNDILDEKKDLFFYGSRKMALIAFKHYPENFIQKRADKKIKLKAILAREDRGDVAYKDKKVFSLSELRFLDDLDKVLTNVFIYSDRVAFMSSSENPVGVIIINQEILAQQKLVFNILWKLAKR
jgi:sugar-specific transcriptional regulator TrmB